MLQLNTSQSSIVVYRGDDWASSLVFADSEGNLIDITGWTIFLTVKKNKDDSDAQAIITRTIYIPVNPPGSRVTFSIPNTETTLLLGSYFFDYQYKKADGTIQTVTSGVVTFEKDITRRIT